tara:strand:- start:1844 stop:2374 length:531 start_codon:yes stop_codon:yes gene_type:complete
LQNKIFNMADNKSTTDYGLFLAEERLVKLFKNTLRKDEGFKPKPYKPNPKEEYFTIGYGHYGPDVKPGMSIDKDAAERLLDKDVRTRIKSIRKALPDFSTFSESLQDAVFSEHYRGSIMQSPETRRLINEGKYGEAGDEFLDNDQYRTAEADGIPGIRPRMERVSRELIKFSNAQR